MRHGLFFLFTILILSGCTSSHTPSIPEHNNMSDKASISQRIFVLGDSLSAGYQLPYEDSYPAQLEQLLRTAGYTITVINGGESGDTSEGLLSRLGRVTADAQAGDIALIVIGGNDGLRGMSTQGLEDNIKNIIADLQSRHIQTIIGGMQIPTNLGETYRTAFAEIYPRVAEQTDSILIPFILEGVAGIPELNLRDGIHPNAQGQAIIATTVFDTIITNNLLIQQ